MRSLLRILSLSLGRSTESWLTLLLLLAVLAPTLCLLWFMNRAAQNERLAIRQKLVDAYRGHLTLAQEQLNTYWIQTARELEAQAANLPAPALFAQQVRAGAADALICFDASNTSLAYPTSVTPPKRANAEPGWFEAEKLESTDPVAAAQAFGVLADHTTNTDLAARALQAQARCLARSDQKTEALSMLLGPLSDERYTNAKDSQGRLLVPNAELMALELLKSLPSAQTQIQIPLERLKAQLLSYDNNLPSPQRRFLMHELQKLFTNQIAFPTLAAEDLAAQYIESGEKTREHSLRPTALPGIWQATSPTGRIITLHKSENLLARMRQAMASTALPNDVHIVLLVPGRELEGALLSMPGGPMLPGWRLALSLKDQQLFDTAASQRTAAYIWIGVLVIATVSVLAAITLRLVRRQIALTRLRNDLVANVTHELKTPLSSMRLLVDTLLNSQPLHEQTAREYLQLIAKENVRLSRLIDNFLTFSRIERNKYAFDFGPVSPATIVESAAAAVRERFQPPGCHFEVHIARHLPDITADADAMVTVLLNLLENAWKYSGDEKQITLSATAAGGNVSFAVKDNGIGLSPRDTKRIFKRFYQVDQRLSRTGGGCGLGLSIVKFVVQAHHGTIQVESEPARGSTFTIALPVAHD